MSKKAKQTWTSLLLKGAYNESNAVRVSKARLVSRYDVVDKGTRIGYLYIPSMQRSEPGWLKKVKGFVPGLPKIENRTAASALVLLPAGGRTFALTLGYGRALLEQDSFEDDFGLKATLNAVPPGNIRVVDRSSFDTFAHQTRTQGLRSGDLEQLGLDMEKDILRAVVGHPKDARHGERMAGKDALVFTARADVGEMPALLSEYLSLSRSRQYQKIYPDIDKLSEVRDKHLLKRLEARLLSRMRTGDLDRMWLAVPDFVDWATVGFRYSTASYEPFPDLHLSDFLARLRGDVASLEIKGRRVHAVDTSTGMERESWPLAKCIYYETSLGGYTYVLSNGKWYQIDADFVSTVDKATNSLLAPTALPEYDASDSDEGAYNRRVAKSSGMFRFDRRNVYHGSRKGDQVEPCDLLTKARQLVHVKRYGGSAVLSHLFAQGLVASELFLEDAIYRDKMRAKVKKPEFQALIPTSVDPSRFTIVYAVVGRAPGAKKLAELLPFFSRLNLRNVAKQLKRMGYSVEVQWITNRSA